MKKDYMYMDKWKVFDEKNNFIKTIILKYIDGAKYKLLEPFEKELKENNQYAMLSAEWSKFTNKWIYVKSK